MSITTTELEILKIINEKNGLLSILRISIFAKKEKRR